MISQTHEKMDIKVHRAMVWTGPVLVLAISIGMLGLTQFMPAPDPEADAQEIANMFIEDKQQIRIGCLVMILFFSYFATWCANFAVWQRKMEPGFPVLTYASIALIGVGTVVFIFIPMTWAAASFRPETIDPDITLAMNDWTWFLFLFSWPPFSAWLLLVAIAIFRDVNETPIFPRWTAYSTLWVAVLLCPAALMAFFKDGPFAYDGILALWLPFCIFFVWMCFMTYYLLHAINVQERRQLERDETPRAAAVATPASFAS